MLGLSVLPEPAVAALRRVFTVQPTLAVETSDRKAASRCAEKREGAFEV